MRCRACCQQHPIFAGAPRTAPAYRMHLDALIRPPSRNWQDCGVGDATTDTNPVPHLGEMPRQRATRSPLASNTGARLDRLEVLHGAARIAAKCVVQTPIFCVQLVVDGVGAGVRTILDIAKVRHMGGRIHD